ncbi:hypothetical protein OAS39_09540, partial [Pirellulales bacterium]|nr:hypothetical protein [Pirellulales bacterium]
TQLLMVVTVLLFAGSAGLFPVDGPTGLVLNDEPSLCTKAAVVSAAGGFPGRWLARSTGSLELHKVTPSWAGSIGSHIGVAAKLCSAFRPAYASVCDSILSHSMY